MAEAGRGGSGCTGDGQYDHLKNGKHRQLFLSDHDFKSSKSHEDCLYMTRRSFRSHSCELEVHRFGMRSLGSAQAVPRLSPITYFSEFYE